MRFVTSFTYTSGCEWFSGGATGIGDEDEESGEKVLSGCRENRRRDDNERS